MKKKYEFGSLVVVDKRELFKQSVEIHALESEENYSSETYPFEGEFNSADISNYQKIAMSGPFGT